MKSIILENKPAITITPILKTSKERKEVPFICVISDEDESSEYESSEEDIQINLDPSEKSKSSQNKENHRTNGIQKSINEDCEIVLINDDTEKIIDIADVEDTMENKVNIDVIELQNQNEEENETDLCIVVDHTDLENSENKIGCDNDIESNVQLEGLQDEDENPKTIKIEKKKNSMSPSSNDAISENTLKELANSDLIENYLEICKINLENTEYNLNNKFDILKQYYKKCEPTMVESDDFRKLIENSIKKAKASPSQAVISFGEVFMHLKDLYKLNSVEVTKEVKRKLKKMEHTIKLLVNKIKELENEDVDFSNEEDSSYMKLER